jgi:ATPase subunit of ABC transporter with duplicated ATPase domains
LGDERSSLIGPNGAGKSAFLWILAGMASADAGEVSRRKNTCMVYLPQEDVLDPEKTIEETLFQDIPQALEAWQVSKRRQEVLHLIEVDNTSQSKGYQVVTQKFPSDITPKNRLLMGEYLRSE